MDMDTDMHCIIQEITDIDIRLGALEAQIKQLETEVHEFILGLRDCRFAEIGQCEKALRIRPRTAQIRAMARKNKAPDET